MLANYDFNVELPCTYVLISSRCLIMHIAHDKCFPNSWIVIGDGAPWRKYRSRLNVSTIALNISFQVSH